MSDGVLVVPEVPRDDQDRPPPVRRVIGAFLLAFVVMAAVVRIAAPPDPEGVERVTLTAKLDHLRTTDVAYDLVMVGNSRALRALDPAVIDAERAQVGCPGRSFNLAAQALTKLELDHVLSVLDDLPAGQPEVVVTVDVAQLSVGYLQDYDVIHRTHLDLLDAPRYVSYRAHLPEPYFTSSPLALADTALAFLANQYPVGALHGRVWGPRPIDDPIGGAIDTGGYRSLEDTPGTQGRRRSLERLVDSGRWEDRWRERQPTEAQLDDWVATIEAHVDAVPDGSVAAHLFVPSVFDAGTAAAIDAAWTERGGPEPLIDLVDETVLPQMTEPGSWFDGDHLSRRGAIDVSRAFARAVCPLFEDA